VKVLFQRVREGSPVGHSGYMCTERSITLLIAVNRVLLKPKEALY